MAVATTSWIDAVMVLMLVASIGFGFRQGFLRQLVLLVAIYVGTVLSAQHHGLVADLILSVFPSSVEMARMIAFVISAVALTIAVTALIWTAYRQTRLPSVVMLDEVGGAILGSLIGVFVIGLSLTLAQHALEAPWPPGSPVKDALHSGMLNSSLDTVFSTPLPLIHAALRPWLPSGIPVMLGG